MQIFDADIQIIPNYPWDIPMIPHEVPLYPLMELSKAMVVPRNHPSHWTMT